MRKIALEGLMSNFYYRWKDFKTISTENVVILNTSLYYAKKYETFESKLLKISASAAQIEINQMEMKKFFL